MAWLHGVVRADAQHRAGVSTRPISHHDYTWPVAAWDAAQVFLCELKQKKIKTESELLMEEKKQAFI